MRPKMTLADLKGLYPPYKPNHYKEDRDGKTIRTHATQRNHRHLVQPVWLPAVPAVRPAAYRRLKIKRPIPAKSSPAVNKERYKQAEAVYKPAVSKSGKQNNPAYRKRFGSRSK